MPSEPGRPARGRTWPLWIAAALIAVVAVRMWQGQQQAAELWPAGEGPALPAFSLHDTAGRTVTAADFQGRASLLFFGFTQCPDICPTTLAMLRQVWTQLDDDVRARAQVVFVAVDPANDTPAAVRAYVQGFHADFRGLVGNHAALMALAKPLGVFFGPRDMLGHQAHAAAAPATIARVDPHAAHAGHTNRATTAPPAAATAPAGGPILHTASVLLVGPEGTVRRAFGPPQDPAEIVAAVAAVAPAAP